MKPSRRKEVAHWIQAKLGSSCEQGCRQRIHILLRREHWSMDFVDHQLADGLGFSGSQRG
ncbi:MAG: hypothetical protein AB7F79_12965 [Steroidobacteraceae bacterium]